MGIAHGFFLQFGTDLLKMHVAISFMFFEKRLHCNVTLRQKVFCIHRHRRLRGVAWPCAQMDPYLTALTVQRVATYGRH